MKKYKKYIEKRPWGKFEKYVENKVCTVKLHYINPNQEWSLQYHNKREEFYKIIEGSAEVTIGNKIIKAKKDDQFFVSKKTKHRIRAGKELVKVLEICFGKFDEKDEVRLEDKYNRK
ncbi:MAG: phosphomannose isomerase type II C-terminal cupin domain [Candidatus Nealsonbacteria bacterium]